MLLQLLMAFKLALVQSGLPLLIFMFLASLVKCGQLLLQQLYLQLLDLRLPVLICSTLLNLKLFNLDDKSCYLLFLLQYFIVFVLSQVHLDRLICSNHPPGKLLSKMILDCFLEL